MVQMIIPDILKHAPFNGNYEADRIAVAGSNGDLTYADLFNLVEVFKRYFRNCGLKQGNPLFIYGHKEREIPALMLAAMDYGLPWVPIDPAFPEGRIQTIMETCGAGLAVSMLPATLVSGAFGMVSLQNMLLMESGGARSFANLNENFTQPIAYVLFTSGTTGQPKGVCISRQNLLSFINWLDTDYPYSDHEVMFNHALFTFDVSLYDVFGALLKNGTVVLNSRDLLNDPSRSIQRMNDYACTTWTSTPALAHIFLMQDTFCSEHLPHIRNFIFAGEPLPARSIEKLHERFPGRGVYNAYGPTEATVTTTLVKIDPEVLSKYTRIPVGYPRSGNSVALLKAETESEREVIIRGDHVSPGYLNRPDLNKTKFFLSDGMWAYRSGDCGYFEDGLLFVTGRIDEQIKFNGYRIEPAEVEALLLKILPPGSNAAVIPLKRGTEVKRILAMIAIPAGLSMPGTDQITQALSLKLPAYMIPSEFFFTEEWFLNPSGKTDKNALLNKYLESSAR